MDKSKKWLITGIIVAALAAASVIASVYITRSDGAEGFQKSTTTMTLPMGGFELPGEDHEFDMRPYNEVIYFTRDFIEPGDRWAWTAFPCTAIEGEQYQFPNVARVGLPDDQVAFGYFTESWQPVADWALEEGTASIVVGDQMGLGFRLPDDVTEAELDSYGLRLDEFLWNNKPCEVGI